MIEMENIAHAYRTIVHFRIKGSCPESELFVDPG